MARCVWNVPVEGGLEVFSLQAAGELGPRCPARSRPVGTILPTAFSHLMSLCHISVILRIYQTLHYYYICGDL